MLLPDATKQWLYQASHALVMSSRVLGSVPLSYVDWLCRDRSPLQWAAASLNRILHSGSGEEEKNNLENRMECCKLLSQQEMDYCKYLINVQRIGPKFENYHPFSVFFSVFQPVLWRHLDLKSEVAEMLSCRKYVYLWTQLETIHCIGSVLPACPILQSHDSHKGKIT